MSEAIIVALISGGVTLIGTVISVIVSHKGTLEKIDANSKVADEKIQGEINVLKADIRTLSNRVEAHNKVIERTYKLEERMSVAEERISDAHHRINEVRGD